jgi:hypothetical protein
VINASVELGRDDQLKAKERAQRLDAHRGREDKPLTL